MIVTVFGRWYQCLLILFAYFVCLCVIVLQLVVCFKSAEKLQMLVIPRFLTLYRSVLLTLSPHSQSSLSVLTLSPHSFSLHSFSLQSLQSPHSAKQKKKLDTHTHTQPSLGNSYTKPITFFQITKQNTFKETQRQIHRRSSNTRVEESASLD